MNASIICNHQFLKLLWHDRHILFTVRPPLLSSSLLPTQSELVGMHFVGAEVSMHFSGVLVLSSTSVHRTLALRV